MGGWGKRTSFSRKEIFHTTLWHAKMMMATFYGASDGRGDFSVVHPDPCLDVSLFMVEGQADKRLEVGDKILQRILAAISVPHVYVIALNSKKG